MIRSNLTWIEERIPELKDKTLVTLSMEGCIHELHGDAREANTKGGLGIYFGDKLEGIKAIGMDRAFGCMPLYKSRLIQSIRNGKQYIEYREVSYEDQPIERVIDSQGNPMTFDVWGWDITNTSRDIQYKAQVYSIKRGGTLLYLFYCPEVFDILYPDDRTHHGYGREHRFLQETIFGECVYGLLKCIDVVPDILHLNEGHVADAAAILKGDNAFSKTTIVYTNHTVVPAGLERFYINRVTGGDIGRARYAMRFLESSYENFWNKFTNKQGGEMFIDFSKGALEICDIANGVSLEHAEATQGLFPHYNRTIEGVLNGSGDSWILDDLRDDKLKDIALDKEAFIEIAAKGKKKAFEEVKKRTAGITDKAGQFICHDGVTLDPDLPTLWMVRRMVKYKSQLPILREIVHVICADKDEVIDTRFGRVNGLQMQVVVGGIAPENSEEEGWIEEFVSWMKRPELKGRFVYVPNADTILLKMQAIGADICINCPMPEKEACGTSDQRTARNGGINIATRSGGPLEYIEDGKSGMLVGPYANNMDFYSRAPGDFLLKLTELSNMYYNQFDGDNRWLDMKLESYLASSKVTAAAMEQRYASLYAQTLNIEYNFTSETIAESNETVNINDCDESELRLNEAIFNLPYCESLLRNWAIISGSPDFDCKYDNISFEQSKDASKFISESNPLGKTLESIREFMKSDLTFDSNNIELDSVNNCSTNTNLDASLLLLWAIKRYLDSTKDYDFLDSISNSAFFQKQTMIIQHMLKDIVKTNHEGIRIEEIPHRNNKENKNASYSVVNSRLR